MKDSLGDRMKGYYENAFRAYLPRRTNLIIRVDGKAFHTFTKKCKKPFDDTLINAMNQTMIALCEGIQGAKLGYVQSDEISIWVTDYDTLETGAWFDNNEQKIVSIAASIATANFNKIWFLANQANWNANRKQAPNEYPDLITPAMFDARVFVIPETAEVANYFLWRSQDAARNSVQMVARSMFSHKQLDGVKIDPMKKMIERAGPSWEDYSPSLKHGRVAYKIPTSAVSTDPKKEVPSDRRHYFVIDGLPEVTFKTWNGYVQNVLDEIKANNASE